uniref:Uncharacterized protein n=1 Tax=Meloidogyne hapla TaxID=6305 RepID=A0A1I8B5E5_MELHA
MFCRLVAVFFAFLCLQQCCETMLRRPEKRQKVATNVDKLIDLTKKLKEDIKDLIGKGHNDFGNLLNFEVFSGTNPFATNLYVMKREAKLFDKTSPKEFKHYIHLFERLDKFWHEGAEKEIETLNKNRASTSHAGVQMDKQIPPVGVLAMIPVDEETNEESKLLYETAIKLRKTINEFSKSTKVELIFGIPLHSYNLLYIRQEFNEVIKLFDKNVAHEISEEINKYNNKGWPIEGGLIENLYLSFEKAFNHPYNEQNRWPKQMNEITEENKAAAIKDMDKFNKEIKDTASHIFNNFEADFKNKYPNNFNDEEILELLNLYEQTKNKNENIKHPQNVILLKAWYLAEYAIKNALKNVDEYLAVYDEIYLNLMIKYLYKEISEKLKIPEEFLEHEIQIINTENTVNNRVLSALIRVNAAKVLLMYYRLKNIFGVFNFINVKNKHYFVNGGKIFTQKDPKTFTPLYFENHIFNMMKYFESKKENKGKQIQKVTCSASDDFELSDSN